MIYLELNTIWSPIDYDKDDLKEDKNYCINDILSIFWILLDKIE